MNHNGNANKMVDTPRTDDESFFMHHSRYDFCKADLARQLERELNAASKERDDALAMLGTYRMKSDDQKQRIKRLEEALHRIANQDYRGNRSTESQIAFDALKEAKP